MTNTANGLKTAGQKRTAVPSRAPSTNKSKAAGTKAAKLGDTYYASIYPGPSEPVANEFAEQILKLEQIFDLKIWLIVQNGYNACSEISVDLFKRFRRLSTEVEACGDKCAILLESPGGDADSAYRLGRFFQRRCKELTVIIPQYAKSAATLLALSAKNIILGRDAELGPLDVQLLDWEKEDYGSALNSAQSLERLNAFGLAAMDNAMELLLARTRKKMETLLPLVLNYTAQMARPLLEKIDVVDYTRKSRDLKVAEEYAARLLRPYYKWTECQIIARKLVEKYPAHGFVIDSNEAAENASVFGLGLKLRKGKEDADRVFHDMAQFLDKLTVVGRIHKKEMR